MQLSEILINIIIISLFCLGLRTILSDGMILHFIRKPFEGKKGPGKYDYLLKPVILCVVCFASVWGASVFITLNGWDKMPELIICCISSTFIIKAINDKVEF